jgi:curved DNA-binding protein CbpA
MAMTDLPPFDQDPYQELGLDPAVSDADLRQAYFTLVRKHGPEQDPARFKRIRAAYERLSSPERRQETDLLRLQPWPAPDLPPLERDPGLWAQDVLRAAKALSDLDRRHFREDFREVKS